MHFTSQGHSCGDMPISVKVYSQETPLLMEMQKFYLKTQTTFNSQEQKRPGSN